MERESRSSVTNPVMNEKADVHAIMRRSRNNHSPKWKRLRFEGILVVIFDRLENLRLVGEPHNLTEVDGLQSSKRGFGRTFIRDRDSQSRVLRNDGFQRGKDGVLEVQSLGVLVFKVVSRGNPDAVVIVKAIADDVVLFKAACRQLFGRVSRGTWRRKRISGHCRQRVNAAGKERRRREDEICENVGYCEGMGDFLPRGEFA
jgi:hypothetical protein